MYPILIIQSNPDDVKISEIISNFKNKDIDLLRKENLATIKKAIFNYYGFKNLKEKKFVERFFIINGPQDTIDFYDLIEKIKDDYKDNKQNKKDWLIIFCLMKNFLNEEKERVNKKKGINNTSIKETIRIINSYIKKIEEKEKTLIKKLNQSYREVVLELKDYDGYNEKMVERWECWMVEKEIDKIKHNKKIKNLKI